MKTLDCGCEVTPDGNTLLSLCSMHAGHMAMRSATDRLERNKPKPDREPLRAELLVAIAPEVVRAAAMGNSSFADFVGDRCMHWSAEFAVGLVDQIVRRLD